MFQKLVRRTKATRRVDRRGSAAAIRNLLDAAEEPAESWLAYGIDPPLRSAAVLESRDDLLAIAAVLESEIDQPQQILECVSWLTWSRASPVCCEPSDDDGDVKDIAGRLREALG